MKVILKNTSLVFQEGVNMIEIEATKTYDNVLCNFNSSNGAQSLNGYFTKIYEIPNDATELYYDGGLNISINCGISLIKDVTLGNDVPTYTNVAKNMFRTEYDAAVVGDKIGVKKTINLADYPGATHFMFSSSSATFALGTGGVSKIYNVG